MSEPKKPEGQWTKGDWRAEALGLRDMVEALEALHLTPPTPAEPIRVDNAQAREKIEQLQRRVAQLSSGKPGRQLSAVRSWLGQVEPPIDAAALAGLRDLLR